MRLSLVSGTTSAVGTFINQYPGKRGNYYSLNHKTTVWPKNLTTEKVLSPSQVGTFGTEDFGGNTPGCQRKWAFKYLSKVPDKGTEITAIGKRVHSFLEAWLRDSILPKGNQLEAKIARAMIKKLPPPPHARVEERFELLVDGVPWRGVKDLVYTRTDPDTGASILVVHDHKTTSGLQWAKDAETLRHDVQSIVYARHAFTESDVVALSWLYGTREKTPQVLPVELIITFEEVQAAMVPITAAGKRVLELYKENPAPNSLPPNLDICKAFGECPFFGDGSCELTPAQRAAAVMRQHNKKAEKLMGFRDRIKQQQPESKPAESDAPAKPSMREKLNFGSTLTPPAFDKPADKEVIDTTGEVVSEETAAPAKKKGGRPKGSKNKAAEALAAIAASIDAEAAAQSNEPTESFELLVNTFPQGREYIEFSKFIRPVLEQVAEANGVEHYKQIDFGKGAGMYAAALYTYLQANPLQGRLVVDINTDEGRDALPTLERFARIVYRRF